MIDGFNIKIIDDSLRDKTVMLRVDFNLPRDVNGIITNENYLSVLMKITKTELIPQPKGRGAKNCWQFWHPKWDIRRSVFGITNLGLKQRNFR